MNRKSITILAVALVAAASSFAVAGGKKSRLSQDDSLIVQRAGSSEVRLTANLGGGDAPQAKSTYRERARNGVLAVRWKVELEDFTPGEDVPVSINGSFVGNIIPNKLGVGVIQFRTSIDDPGDGMPLPEGFPRLKAGDTVTVGNLSATYN